MADSKKLPAIDCHCHFIPKEYYKLLEENNLLLDDSFPVPSNYSVESHLEDMEKIGIGISILDLSSPNFWVGNIEQGRTMARKINEFAADMCQKYPGKFGFMATLPMPDIEGSLKELEYAFDVLKADGVRFYTNSSGLYLGQPEMDPIFEEMNRRKTVMTYHPTRPYKAIPDNVLEGVPVPLFEFNFDSCRAVGNLIFKDVFGRYPNIKFIVTHLGGLLPVLADRILLVSNVLASKGSSDVFKAPPDVFGLLKSFYYDFAGGAGLPVQIPALRHISDPTHWVYGSDYPFTNAEPGAKLGQALRNSPLLTDDELAGVLQNNALRDLFPRFK